MADEIPKEVIAQLKHDIQSELSKKAAGWAIAGGAGVVVLAALGAWTLLKPKIASELEVVPRSELETMIPKQAQIKDIVAAELMTQGVNFPDGAVIAFDLSPTSPAECPDGWTSHRELRGRMVVGAGAHSNTDENGNPLTQYSIGQIAGAEQHKLTIDQMPAHSHGFTGMTVTRGGWGGQPTRTFAIGGSQKSPDFNIGGTIASAGKGQAHNNMPPYMALLYCIKD